MTEDTTMQGLDERVRTLEDIARQRGQAISELRAIAASHVTLSTWETTAELLLIGYADLRERVERLEQGKGTSGAPDAQARRPGRG